MADIIIENIVKITAALLLMLIAVLGTYLTALASKRAETANVAEALRSLTEAAKPSAETKRKMLPSTINLINGAGADIEAIILGVGESLINKAKQ